MKVLTIIVSYNFEQWIDRCLGSLYQSDYPTDIVVIDNASKDQTVQRIKTDYPQVQLIENPSNLGFGQANNIGMKLALEKDYEVVFLMNQDAWVAKNTIGTLIHLSKVYPQYGILSPVHLTASEKRLDPGFSSYIGVETCSQLSTDKEIIPLPFVNAAFWMIPTAVLKQVGGFSPLFYHYGEDKDFINRICYHHFQVGYSPLVFGCHDREYRPMDDKKFLHTEYVYHLSEYANLNYPFHKAFGYGILAGIKKSFKAISKGKWKRCTEYLSISVRLLLQSCQIYRYRKENIKSYPNYLL